MLFCGEIAPSSGSWEYPAKEAEPLFKLVSGFSLDGVGVQFKVSNFQRFVFDR